jgi:hypothetical protein
MSDEVLVIHGGCGIFRKKNTPLNGVWNYHVIRSKPKVYNNSGFYRHSSLALIFRYEYGPTEMKVTPETKNYLTLHLKPLEKHRNLESPVY